MENASKALIIAGAILLAIVIISLGLIVVNNSRSAVDSASMTEQEIQTFNAKFLPYQGTKNTAQVKTLLQAVIANNTNSNNSKINIKVGNTKNIGYGSVPEGTDTTNGVNTAQLIGLISGTLVSGADYDVSIGYGSGSLVSTITIKGI